MPEVKYLAFRNMSARAKAALRARGFSLADAGADKSVTTIKLPPKWTIAQLLAAVRSLVGKQVVIETEND